MSIKDLSEMKDISYQTGRIIRNTPVSLTLASLFELI